MKVDLPPAVWANREGGLQVEIRWAPEAPFDNLRLYVYPQGAIVAQSDIDFWDRKGDGPRTYTRGPDCLMPYASDGVADGLYALETIADPDDLLREADEGNNCSSILIRLRDVDSATPSVRVVGPGPRCSALGR